MRRAVVVGASGGIGEALVAGLRARGAEEVVGLSRRADGLDVTDEAQVAAAAARLDDGVPVDALLVATGVLTVGSQRPERAFKELDPAVMARAYAVNAVGPALVLKHFARLLPRDRPAAVGVLSARVGSIADNHLGGWMSYRASKAALHQLVRCAALELGRTHPRLVLVALHPGTVETSLSTPYARGRFTHGPPEAASRLLDVLFGLGPEASGRIFDYAGVEIPG
jgi:NAD(P)-dependent dehydrogenase (short-subunit alcohol dehydrogenase family)